MRSRQLPQRKGGKACRPQKILVGILIRFLVFLQFISMIAGSLGGLARSEAGVGAKAFGLGLGLGAIIVAPILYGIIGGVERGNRSPYYNLVAGWIGGLEVDVS